MSGTLRQRITAIGCPLSSALFGLALVALPLPWHDIGSGVRSGLDFLFPVGVHGPAAIVTLVGLVAIAVAIILGFRVTRGAAMVRAAIAGVALGPFLLHFGWSLVLGGDLMVLGIDTARVGAWISFLALVGALVTNIVLVGTMNGQGRATGRARPKPV